MHRKTAKKLSSMLQSEWWQKKRDSHEIRRRAGSLQLIVTPTSCEKERFTAKWPRCVVFLDSYVVRKQGTVRLRTVSYLAPYFVTF